MSSDSRSSQSRRAFYFGCYGQAGHYFHDERMRHRWEAEQIVPWGFKVDGGLAPTIGYRQEAPQGHAALHHKAGWTALSFWDRSGDSRGNSSSTFLFEDTLTFDEALAEARERFPALFKRFPFEIVEWQEHRRAA
jgi:hypothetical protein